MRLTISLVSLFVGSTFLAYKPATTHTAYTTEPVSNKKASQPVGVVYIVIDKSDYELNVYDERGWYATYPVVFGNNTLEDKKMEGDKNTPEGSFSILSKKVHDKWDRYIALNYPTKDSYEKFNQRKKNGEIPAKAKIGGSIGIHGTWPHDDYLIDRYKNWTDGCIAMKNKDVEDLYGYIQSGVKVTIRQ